MSNITDYRFVLYERLASQKLNEILSALNSHNHGNAGGVPLDVNTAIDDGTLEGAKIKAGTITGLQLANDSVTTNHIVDGTITYSDLNTSSIHLSADGYAVYAP